MNTGTAEETNKTANAAKPVEIFVIMKSDVVHEIVNLPPNIKVTMIEYDTEGVEKDRLEISPVDGELCEVTKW